MRLVVCFLLALLILIGGCRTAGTPATKALTKPLVLRIKIYVEYLDGVPSRSIREIMNDLSAASLIGSPINLYFNIVEINKINCDIDWDNLWYIQNHYISDPTCCHVYYMYSRDMFSMFKTWYFVSGMGPYPWSGGNGFFITNLCQDNNTFMHELGHCGGLEHWFQTEDELGKSYNTMDYVSRFVPIENIFMTQYQFDRFVKYIHLYHPYWIDYDF